MGFLEKIEFDLGPRKWAGFSQAEEKALPGQGNDSREGREAGISTSEAAAPRVETGTEEDRKQEAGGRVGAPTRVADYSGSRTGEFPLGVDGNTRPLQLSEQ